MSSTHIPYTLTGSSLKIIALFAMLLDHIGAILFPQFILLRIIGRIAFPIFCFLLIEGFIHTHNSRKYASRLLIFALISEVPFDLAITHRAFYLDHQNIFFTLFIGLLVLIGIRRYSNHVLMQILIIWTGCLFARILKVDYNLLGVLMIVLFYYFRDRPYPLIPIFFLINYLGGGSFLQGFATFALLPIMLYNGQRGCALKYVFYIFYPLHLLILYFISYTINSSII